MKLIMAFIISLILSGCVQSPTRNTEVVDDRPGLSFELTSPASRSYELKIDGVSYGRIEQYLAGENRLRIIDGKHKIVLIDNGRIVFSKNIYLGTGSNRILKVGNYE